MKYFHILLIFPFFIALYQANDFSNDLEWTTDYASARKIAKEDGKNMLVYFTGSDWCGPCIQLKKDLFAKDRFISISKDFVLVYVDIPRKKTILSPEQLEHNMALLPKLNKKGVFPFFIILNSEEKILGELSGYNMDGEIERHLKFFEKNK